MRQSIKGAQAQYRRCGLARLSAFSHQLSAIRINFLAGSRKLAADSRVSGRGAFLLRWSSAARQGGAIGSENVGMSNRKSPENGDRRKPKVSLAMTISQGLGDPNPSSESCQEMDSRLIFRPSYTFLAKRRRVRDWEHYWICFTAAAHCVCCENPKYEARNPKQALN